MVHADEILKQEGKEKKSLRMLALPNTPGITMEPISFAAEFPFKLRNVAAVRTASTPQNWRGETPEENELIFWNSSNDMSSANSLSYALENSLKLWQVFST